LGLEIFLFVLHHSEKNVANAINFTLLSYFAPSSLSLTRRLDHPTKATTLIHAIFGGQMEESFLPASQHHFPVAHRSPCAVLQASSAHKCDALSANMSATPLTTVSTSAWS
jgi:hypothetical protein